MGEAFSNSFPHLVRPEGWRIDVLAVSYTDCQSAVEPVIRHYENV
jgi:hypothetical protein